MTKKRVFLSFRGEDLDHVRGLRLLAANPDYELDFYDESVRAAIQSSQAEYIKRVIREKIKRASVTVCLISELTHTSEWIDWELDESRACGNKIIAMALKGVESARLPRLIKDMKLTFHAWDPAALGRLIAGA